jgi:hypothetical protein
MFWISWRRIITLLILLPASDWLPLLSFLSHALYKLLYELYERSLLIISLVLIFI